MYLISISLNNPTKKSTNFKIGYFLIRRRVVVLLFGKVLGLQSQQTQYSKTGVRDATGTHNVKQKEATDQNVAASMGERFNSNGGDDDEEENSEDSLLSSAGEEEDEVMMA